LGAANVAADLLPAVSRASCPADKMLRDSNRSGTPPAADEEEVATSKSKTGGRSRPPVAYERLATQP